MKKINFKQFKMFTDISQEKTTTVDLSKQFADTIYKNGVGISAHDLAFRIYRAEGEIELSDDDISVLNNFLSQTTPIFQDSFSANLL